MKIFEHFGYEYFSCDLSVTAFLALIKRKHLQVYGIDLTSNIIIFKVKPSTYYRTLKADRSIKYEYASGMLGFISKQLHNPKRIVGLISAIVCLYLLSSTLFEIDIIGNNMVANKAIRSYLKENGISEFMYVNDPEIFGKVENDIKQLMFKQIEWINFEYTNSRLKVNYVMRKQPLIIDNTYEPIRASKDGVIKGFNVSSGKKMVSLNDLVRTGDILISPNILDSKGVITQVFTKGKVYADTFTEINSVLNQKNDLSDYLAFFRLLFDCRNQISKELTPGEKIIEENILQFSKNEGTIRMKIQYTLYEDISSY